MTLTDTVGFIQDIPTQLIHAFESTLEESKCVDMLLHVVDSSSENYQEHEKVVLQLIKDLEMEQIPLVTIYNKKDMAQDTFFATITPSIQMSAIDVQDMMQLEQFLWENIKKELVYYHKQLNLGEEALLASLIKETFVEHHEFNAERLQYEVTGYASPTSQFVKQTNEEKEVWE